MTSKRTLDPSQAQDDKKVATKQIKVGSVKDNRLYPITIFEFLARECLRKEGSRFDPDEDGSYADHGGE